MEKKAVEYFIPVEESRCELKIKNSIFKAFLFKCEQSMSVAKIIKKLRKDVPGANHYVYAFCLGAGNQTLFGMSDDGEPSGTAGRPLLEVVKGSGLGDLLVVVVRYFGGTKLGTGGLVRAYTQAGQRLIALAGKKLKVPLVYGRCAIAYDRLSFLERIFIKRNAEILQKDFQESVLIEFCIPQKFKEAFNNEFIDLTMGDNTVRWKK